MQCSNKNHSINNIKIPMEHSINIGISNIGNRRCLNNNQMPNQYECNTHDKLFHFLNKLKEHNRHKMLDNYNRITQQQHDNEYLKDIYLKYKQMYEHIINQKKQNENKIKLLIDYLEKNMYDEKHDDSKYNALRHQHSILIKKLHEIHEGVENIMDKANNVNELSHTLNEQI